MRCDRNARGDKHKSTQPTASLKCQQGSQSQLASRVARAILAETALPTKTTRCGVLCVVQPELVWLEAFTKSQSSRACRIPPNAPADKGTPQKREAGSASIHPPGPTPPPTTHHRQCTRHHQHPSRLVQPNPAQSPALGWVGEVGPTANSSSRSTLHPHSPPPSHSSAGAGRREGAALQWCDAGRDG